MEAVWLALQESAFAAAIRNATFIYPIANILHVVGAIAFFGVVATMDLRLLRAVTGEAGRTVVDRLRPVAAALLIVIAVAGAILFAADAVALAGNPAFRIKIAAIVLALANIGLNEWALRRRGEGSRWVRASAGASLFAWLFVATMGRSIAYV